VATHNRRTLFWVGVLFFLPLAGTAVGRGAKRATLPLVIACAGLLLLSSCGGSQSGSPPQQSVQKGTYDVIVRAASGSLQTSTTVHVTVQ